MTVETQIVVIGEGGAGLSAATAAAEMGADVIVLEKRETLGGNSAFAEGLFAAESPAQKRMNIDARRDEAFKIAMSYAGVGYVQCNPQWQHLGFRDQLWTDCR